MIIEEIEPILIKQPDGTSKIGVPHELDKFMTFKIENNPFSEMWNLNSVTIDQLKLIYFKHEIYFYIFFTMSLLFEIAVMPSLTNIVYSIIKQNMIKKYSLLLSGIIVNALFSFLLLIIIIFNIINRSSKKWKNYTVITLLWVIWQLFTPTIQGRYFLIVISTRTISAIIARFLSKVMDKMSFSN
ncbi:hypothetical protein FG386_002388 [Cryptosporidium ryanae]|uniref:uncharacterized protein n=1 Tax=Cryptosporidium ryanae TaxID=515981 RepID=UPI00351A3BE9|nr:hypothetical protein FG386_002388 [Cryptosporidium ryanae]